MELSTEIPLSKFILSITDRKLRDKLLKEKELDLPKVIELIQQNTYERKNLKNSILEALISNRVRHQGRTYTQNSTYREVRNTTEKETKRPKL